MESTIRLLVSSMIFDYLSNYIFCDTLSCVELLGCPCINLLLAHECCNKLSCHDIVFSWMCIACVFMFIKFAFIL